MLRDLLALATSRRLLVPLALVGLMAARWYLLGPPAGAELGAFVASVAAWVTSEARRRHEGRILTSRRLMLTLAQQLLVHLGGRLGLDLPPELVATLSASLAVIVLGEGTRRHPDRRKIRVNGG